ncbi:MAG: KpsF/GutQ family sugar-phosphate isomerase [Oceanospirillaceae bacterium]|nr:KpsF/GutQ family sugar-phosphate isomerase [Oceanospirillaceae bacterium]
MKLRKVVGTNDNEILSSGIRSISEQAKALNSLSASLDAEFVYAVKLILENSGRLIISGMGKSGHIGRKMAASLASTGTRAFFVHPGEAFHGDLGMIAPEDIVLLISNSGETDEILKLIPTLKSFGNKIIGLHGNAESTLAKHSDVNLIARVKREVCPHNLAPTTSTIAAMALGDALTVALMEQRDFQPHDFARFHPGGSLGRRLLTSVKDVMKSNGLPVVTPDTLVRDCLFVMTKSRTGLAIVVDRNKIVGTLTDGDLRRALLVADDAMMHPVKDYMTSSPVTIHENEKLASAEDLLKQNKIKALLVVDDEEQLVGLVEYNV